MLIEEMEIEGEADHPDFLHQALDYKPRDAIEFDTHISLKHDYVYLMVCKAASRTVTYHLQCVEYRGTRYKPTRVRSPHLAPFQLSRTAFCQVMTSPRIRKFTFVRNPYSRLLSCYLHRVVGKPTMNPSKRRLAKYTKGDPGQLSFERFIDIVADQENGAMERHWAVQHDAVLYPLIRYDLIGKLESLAEDLLKLEARLFGREVFDRSALHLIKARMQTNSISKLREYYTDRIADKVAARYAIDFETFGYSRDLADAL